MTNRITARYKAWFASLSPERQFDIEVKLGVAILALFIIWLAYAWWFNGEAIRRIQEVNSLYANLSQNMSTCGLWGR